MKAILLLFCVIAALFAYKKRTPTSIAIVIGLAAATWQCSRWYDSYMDILWTGLLVGGVCYVGLRVFMRNRFAPTPNASQPTQVADEMKLILGRVLDTKSSSQVFSDTHLGRDVFGNLDSYTTHEVVTSHNTWLYDLNRNIETNYSGAGSLKARPGHIIGTMSWKGTSFLTINYSTNTQAMATAPNTSLLGALIMGGAFVLLGWAMFPVFALLAPLTWMKVLKWRGGGLFTDYELPGTRRYDAIAVYLGGLVYIAFVAAVINGATHNSDIGTLFVCAFVFYVLLFQWVMRALKSKFDVLIAQGKQELNARYEQFNKQQASSQATQATPVV